MSSYLGVSHFVMMNSGSSANLAIFEALPRPSSGIPMLQKGDGVLVPAIAWATTIWPIVQLGLRAIFVDVDENTLAIDFKKEFFKKKSDTSCILIEVSILDLF